MPLFEKTPLSGPGKLKAKRGRKRTKDDAESKKTEEEYSLENEYKGNNNKIIFMTFMATDTTV